MTITRLLFAMALFGALTAAWGTEAEIKAAEKKWADAITKNDGPALESMLGDDLIYAHSTGIVDTKRDYIAKIASGRQKYEGVDQEKIQIRLYGATAVSHSHMHMWGVNQNGKFDDHLMMLHVWIKTRGQWRMAAHQTTKLR